MDAVLKKDELKEEKEKLKQFIEEQQHNTGTSQGTSGETKENKSDEVIKSSTSASATSSQCNCSVRSCSSTDFYPPKPNERKRKLSRDKAHNSKRAKVQKRPKSLENQRKKVDKKSNKAKQQKSKRSKRKRKDSYLEKSDDGYTSKDDDEGGCTSKDDDEAYKKEYNKKLDALARYGGNFYCPSIKRRKGLRPIYIDGSNVAYSHGQNERFSVKGLKICIEYFRKRGHQVKAFVPHFRLRKGETSDQQLLHELVNKKMVITTPTLYIQNQRRSPYDDWYIIQSAAANGGIIISADNFQDIIKWNPNLRSVIEECRLVPTFVDDMIIFPVDPHGNRQNDLEQFLRF